MKRVGWAWRPEVRPEIRGVFGEFHHRFHEDFTSNLMVLWWSKTHQKNEGKGAILHDLTNTQGDWCLIYVGKIGANHEHVIAGQMIDIEAIDGDYDYKPTKIADGAPCDRVDNVYIRAFYGFDWQWEAPHNNTLWVLMWKTRGYYEILGSSFRGKIPYFQNTLTYNSRILSDLWGP